MRELTQGIKEGPSKQRESPRILILSSRKEGFVKERERTIRSAYKTKDDGGPWSETNRGGGS